MPIIPVKPFTDMERKRSSIYERGYTLLELAVVVVVVGITIAGFSEAYRVYLKEQSVSDTNVHTSLVAQAIANYLNENGRYPCPAAVNLPFDNAKYGVETDCKNGTGYTAAGVAGAAVGVGQCADGICVEESENQTDIAPPGGSPHVPNMAFVRVRRGSVPFRTLNLPEEYAYDGYHHRLEYAVTERLTDPTTYNKDNGGISLLDGASPPQSVVKPAGKTHFLVLSHGEDGIGAYNKEGIQALPCAGVGLDIENCNTGPTTATKKSIYRAAQISSAGGSAQFDDYVSYSSSVDTPFWRVSDDSGFNIRDLAGTTNEIGIGGSSLTNALNLKADISGDIRARDSDSATNNVTPDKGNLLTTDTCNFNGTDCFRSDLIAGNLPQMKCGTPGKKAFVSSLNNSHVDCVDGIQFKCPPGQYIHGINPDGTFNCQTVATVLTKVPPPPIPQPNCPATTVKLCSINESLPLSADKTVMNFSEGFSAKATYTCDAPNARWRNTSSSGVCTCTATDADQAAQQCSTDGTLTGTIIKHLTITCDTTTQTMTKTTTVVSSNCICVPQTKQKTAACPTGQTGLITSESAFICLTASTGQWGPWTVISNTCVCTPDVQTQTLACPVGQSGALIQTRTRQCPAGTFGPWVTDPLQTTCACIPDTQTRTGACPVGQTGVLVETRSKICPAGTSYTAWTIDPVQTTCACIPDTQTRTLACPTGTTGTGSVQTRNFQCPSAVWSSWTTTSSDCVCTPYTETGFISCPSGLTGQIGQTRNWTCPVPGGSPVASAWTQTSNTCVCNPQTQSRNNTCPAGQTGTLVETRSFSCPAAVWSAWTTDPVNTTCACVSSTQSQNVSCPTGQTGNIVQTRTFLCPSATWGPWAETSNTCTCAPSVEGPIVDVCPAGYTGQIIKHRAWTCPGPTAGAWVEDSNTCYLATNAWQPLGTPISQDMVGWGAAAGSSCSTPGAVAQCHQPVPGGGGLQNNYDQCECR